MDSVNCDVLHTEEPRQAACLPFARISRAQIRVSVVFHRARCLEILRFGEERIFRYRDGSGNGEGGLDGIGHDGRLPDGAAGAGEA